jgi:hypothetical protein
MRRTLEILKSSQLPPTGRIFPTLGRAFSTQEPRNGPQGPRFPYSFTAGPYTEPQGLIRRGAGSGVHEVRYGDRTAFVKPLRTSETSRDQTAGREVFASALGRHIVGASVPITMAVENSGEEIPRCLSIAPSAENLIPFSEYPHIHEYEDAPNLKKLMPGAFHNLGPNLALNMLAATGDRHSDQLLWSPRNKKWYEIDFAQSFNAESIDKIGDPAIPYGIAQLGQDYPSGILREINNKPASFLQAVENIHNFSDQDIRESLDKIPVTHFSKEDKDAAFNFVQYRRNNFLEIAGDFLKKHQMENCLKGLRSADATRRRSRGYSGQVPDDPLSYSRPPSPGGVSQSR